MKKRPYFVAVAAIALLFVNSTFAAETTPLKKVACVGDSITFGADLKTAATRPGITHRFVTVDIRRNLVMQISEDNKIEWQHARKTPTDVHQMKNGNFLIAATRNIVEVNPKGNVLWEYKSKKDLFSAVPLANGNRLVGCSGEFRLIELERRPIGQFHLRWRSQASPKRQYDHLQLDRPQLQR